MLLKFVIKKKGAEMQKYLLLLCYMIIIIIIGCSTKNNDWDFSEEMNTNMMINDLSIVELGITVSESLGILVDSLIIEVNITHQDYSNLDIRLMHDTDTLLIWENNYPGGIQEYASDYFRGESVNGHWGLSVHDEVADGNEGWLKKFTLMIKYQ